MPKYRRECCEGLCCLLSKASQSTRHYPNLITQDAEQDFDSSITSWMVLPVQAGAMGAWSLRMQGQIVECNHFLRALTCAGRDHWRRWGGSTQALHLLTQLQQQCIIACRIPQQLHSINQALHILASPLSVHQQCLRLVALLWTTLHQLTSMQSSFIKMCEACRMHELHSLQAKECERLLLAHSFILAPTEHPVLPVVVQGIWLRDAPLWLLL